jgi:RNA polymerase sigma factor (sigma-70 family)
MRDSPSAVGLSAFVRRMTDDHAPDAELLRRYAASRDEAAFAVLVRRHGPTVWRVCRGLARQPADAEDAYQATFLLLVRNAARVRNPHAVGAWLYGTSVKVATKARNKKRPERLEIEPAVELGDITVREAEALFHEELAALPTKFRDPLVLCCLDGLTRDEAANRLGVSLETVKHRLERGRELLKARLLKRGVAVSVPLLAGLLAPTAAAGGPVDVNAVSVNAVSLANEVSNMTHTKWKWVAAVGLATGLLTMIAVAQPPKPANEKQPAPVQPVEVIAFDHEVRRVAMSADGKVMAVRVQRIEKDRDGKPTNWDSMTTIWDTATGKKVRETGWANGGNVLYIALSPDGRSYGEAVRDGAAFDRILLHRLADAEKGLPLPSLVNVTGRGLVPSRFAFAPNGRDLAVAIAEFGADWETVFGGIQIQEQNANGGGHGHGRYSHTGAAVIAGFTPDGKRLLSVGERDMTVNVWDVSAEPKVERSFPISDGSRVQFAVVTPDGGTLATGRATGEIELWDVAKGKAVRTLPEPIATLRGIAVSVDGKRLAGVGGDKEGKLTVWDLKSGKLLLTKGDVGPQVVCFDAAGRVAVCDGSLKKIVFHTVPE